jgi:hypothetical protein
LNKESLRQIPDWKEPDDPKQINNALLGMILKNWGISIDCLTDGAKKEIKSWKNVILAAERGYKAGLLRENLFGVSLNFKSFTLRQGVLGVRSIIRQHPRDSFFW